MEDATANSDLRSSWLISNVSQDMKRIVLIAFAFVFVGCEMRAQETGFNTGMPFGLIGPKEIDRLEAYAKKEGVDLIGDAKRASEKDEEALARVFTFSVKFTKLDGNAKAYGQIVYSSFLNLSEAIGLDRYSKLVIAQPEAVRQRIRDFIFFDATQAPPKERKEVEEEARKSAPLLFPVDYVFGANDPIFKKG
jgi:hypothetical protein